MIINITEEDKNKYLIAHKKDSDIKYREALFLKYLDDTDDKTLEKVEMYLKKLDDKSEFYKKNNVTDLFNFRRYLELIRSCRNIDVYDISLMLVPALGLNNLFIGDIKISSDYINNFSYLLDMNAILLVEGAIYRLRNYSKEYDRSCSGGMDKSIKNIGIFNDTLGNYVRLRNLGIIEYNYDFSFIGKDRCEIELYEYSEIYGKEPVEIIKEYAKELKK